MALSDSSLTLIVLSLFFFLVGEHAGHGIRQLLLRDDIALCISPLSTANVIYNSLFCLLFTEQFDLGIDFYFKIC